MAKKWKVHVELDADFEIEAETFDEALAIAESEPWLDNCTYVNVDVKEIRDE